MDKSYRTILFQNMGFLLKTLQLFLVLTVSHICMYFCLIMWGRLALIVAYNVLLPSSIKSEILVSFRNLNLLGSTWELCTIFYLGNPHSIIHIQTLLIYIPCMFWCWNYFYQLSDKIRPQAPIVNSIRVIFWFILN